MPLRSALVLDDDAPLRTLLRDALGAEGWTVRGTARGEMAMQLAMLRRPDIVLLDVSRPDVAPEALATGLRIHYGPELPILAMSTALDSDVTTRIGAYGFLQKPFEIDRLLSLLERGLNLAGHPARLRAHSDEAPRRLRHLRIVPPPPDSSGPLML